MAVESFRVVVLARVDPTALLVQSECRIGGIACEASHVSRFDAVTTPTTGVRRFGHCRDGGKVRWGGCRLKTKPPRRRIYRIRRAEAARKGEQPTPPANPSPPRGWLGIFLNRFRRTGELPEIEP